MNRGGVFSSYTFGHLAQKPAFVLHVVHFDGVFTYEFEKNSITQVVTEMTLTSTIINTARNN